MYKFALPNGSEREFPTASELTDMGNNIIKGSWDLIAPNCKYILFPRLDKKKKAIEQLSDIDLELPYLCSISKMPCYIHLYSDGYFKMKRNDYRECRKRNPYDGMKNPIVAFNFKEKL